MQKRRLVRAQGHPAINNLMDYVTNSKPFNIEEVDQYHHGIQQTINEASDQAHAVSQLVKGNPKMAEFYGDLYRKLNSLSNSLESIKPNNLS